MQKAKLLIVVLVLSLYGLWREVGLTKQLDQARLYLIGRSSFTVYIVEIMQQSPIQVFCIAKLVGTKASMLVKFPGLADVHVGDKFELKGKAKINLSTTLAGFYRLKEIVAVFSVSDFILVSSNTTFSSHFYYWRSALTEVLQNTLNYNSGSLLAGILWGDSSDLPKSIKSDFQSTGLTHVMAVSGANMTLLAQMLSYLLFFLPIRIRYSIIIVAMIFFCSLVGMSAAVLRAGVMALISAIAVIIGKKYWAIGAFNLVVLLAFLYKPAIIFYDVGFQLSCAATLGLIFLQPVLLKCFKFIPWKSIRETIATTLTASIVTLPIVLYYFSTWYPLSILVNILLLPVVGIISTVLYMVTPLLGVPYVSSIVAVLINLVGATLLASLKYLAVLSSRVVVNWKLPLGVVFLSYSVITLIISICSGTGITSRVNKDLGKGD